jgi:hypothetical protein
MTTLHPFVSLEFSSALGPPAGRYLVRPGGGSAESNGARPDGPAVVPAEDRVARVGHADVLQLMTVGAASARGGLVFRRARKADAEAEPRDVSILIATLIGATNAFAGPSDAVRFLDGCRGDEEEQAALVAQCVEVINLAVRAYRAAARDPYAAEIDATDAREIRIGYGEAEDLARGGWTEAFQPPPPREPKLSRAERLAPTEVVAQVVSGKLPLLVSEDLALRTMLDLEHGRPRVAALQLKVCLDMIVAELTDAGESFLPPRDDLEGRMEAAERLCQLALDDRLDDDAIGELGEILDRVEDALEDWRGWHAG